MYYIHKHDIVLVYNGPEEGGQYYTSGVPTGFSFGPIEDEENAYDQCRALNELEHERAKREEDYDFTSVLSYLSTHYSYSVEDFEDPAEYPAVRPHYE